MRRAPLPTFPQKQIEPASTISKGLEGKKRRGELGSARRPKREPWAREPCSADIAKAAAARQGNRPTASRAARSVGRVGKGGAEKGMKKAANASPPGNPTPRPGAGRRLIECQNHLNRLLALGLLASAARAASSWAMDSRCLTIFSKAELSSSSVKGL